MSSSPAVHLDCCVTRTGSARLLAVIYCQDRCAREAEPTTADMAEVTCEACIGRLRVLGGADLRALVRVATGPDWRPIWPIPEDFYAV